MKDPLSFIPIEEKEHVRWLIVRFGKCGGEKESVCWVSHGFVCAFLEVGAEVPEVGVGLACEWDRHEVGCNWCNVDIAFKYT